MKKNKRIKIKKNVSDMYSGRNVELLRGEVFGYSVDGLSVMVRLDGGLGEVCVLEENCVWW